VRRPWSVVLWFFVLAHVITGAAACVSRFVVHHPDDPRMPYVAFFLKAGPSLAGLLMTLVLDGLAGVRRLAIQLGPWSVGGGWLVLAVCLLPVVVPPSFLELFLVLASLVGVLMVLGLRGRAGIRRAGSQLRGWLLGQGWPVLAVCLLYPLGVIVLSLGILRALGVSVRSPSWEGWSSYLYGAVIGGGLIGPGVFEEIGWRGFALPHLQRRYSALVSSLIIGLAWAFWHFPNFVFPSQPPPWWHLLAFVANTLAVSVVFTWVCNSTGGSLFAVVLLHGAIYTASGLCPRPDPGVQARVDVVFVLLQTAIAVGLVWRYGATNLSWRTRVVAEPPDPNKELKHAHRKEDGR